MGAKKLNGHDVALMRQLYAFFPGLKQKGLVMLFGVRPSTVSLIVRYRTRQRIR